MPLSDGATTAVSVCMGVKPRESVLVITDEGKQAIGQAIFDAAREITENVLLVIMPNTPQHGAEPIRMVRDLMKDANVIFAPTTHSLTHTRARRLAMKAGARVATMPGITDEMMSGGGMTADFQEIQKRIRKVHTRLKGKKTIDITSDEGTNLTFSIERRKWILEDTGICRKKGTFTNLPAGEIFIAPVEESANGKLVVDGSFNGLLEKPVTVTIEDGFATTFSGKEHKRIEQLLSDSSVKLKDPQIAYNVGKFGIGMNPRSKIIGNVLEDEKTLGTIHIGFGGNFTMGGKVQAGIQTEGVIRNPTVYADDLLIISNGELQI
jgi:leucyl aminopeptidase (aminopeptidase T)